MRIGKHHLLSSVVAQYGNWHRRIIEQNWVNIEVKCAYVYREPRFVVAI